MGKTQKFKMEPIKMDPVKGLLALGNINIALKYTLSQLRTSNITLVLKAYARESLSY